MLYGSVNIHYYHCYYHYYYSVRSFTKQKRVKGDFTTRQTNWVHILDDHAKLMGYQRGTLPIAIY